MIIQNAGFQLEEKTFCYTGYFGMTAIGQPKAGETVVVSAASGAVGSIAAALNMIFTGKNHGKLLLKVKHEDTE